jgi:F0F1-type ATP synthase assembly protein I
MEEIKKPDDHRPISQWEAVEFVWELLFVIAVPVTLSALGGRWVDTHWHIAPWGTIIGLVLALASAAAMVLRRGKQMAERMKNRS